MTTQIMFKIEDKLKKAAQKRAKREGITLSDFYQSATKSFVQGRLSVGITLDDDSISYSEYKQGRNIGPFTNVNSLKKSLEM